MTANRTRHTETIVYCVLWLLVAAVLLLNFMRARASLSLPLLDGDSLLKVARILLPFVGLFAICNYVLIPRMLLKNRLAAFFVCLAVLLIVFWAYEYYDFMQHHPPKHAPRHKGMHPRGLMPLPLLLDLTYSLMVVGVNMAVALMFQRFDDRLERESLMKSNAESQLSYLKAQINPHFYMNMLNNIHGMIEINPERAQEMVIDMSQLMRYMLYDSSRHRIPLSQEVAFLDNYMRLMRMRFPEKLVSISKVWPEASQMSDIWVPPLLWLGFIENAFKHGVSYRSESFVAVRLEISGNALHFSCINSVHASSEAGSQNPGIGLANVRRRLQLLYGSDAVLQLTDGPGTYTVNLITPCHESENPHN